MISRTDKLHGETQRGESSTDMITAYKYCQHDSTDEQKEEYLLSDGKQALGRAVITAAGWWRGSPRVGDTPQPGWMEIRSCGTIANTAVTCRQMDWRPVLSLPALMILCGPGGTPEGGPQGSAVFPVKKRHLLSH